MRVAILSSGGKDSAAAWWWAICKGWDIAALVTMRVVGDDSMMFQEFQALRLSSIKLNSLKSHGFGRY